jgi:hypothetical protein
MPSPYGGFAGPGPLTNSPFGAAFGSGPGPGYNYGAPQMQGQAFGNLATSVVGGVGHSMSRAMPVVGALGALKMGSGIGGMMLGGAAGFGVGAIGQHVFGSMMEGAQEQQHLERTLSQFQFMNPMARSGRGFNRQDSMSIGNMVRQMERMPEMLTSFGELNRLMDKMGQMGLMQGVRDAGEFINKFRTTIGTLKDMAKMMGTTMEGALQAFGESRRSGFYSTQDILRNTLNRQLTGSLTGMNQQQVAQLQQYGGELGHARGGSRKAGAQHITRTAAQLGMANQMGILTNDQIVEMTGKEGAEGIQDLSVQMTDLGYRMGRSNVGQALTLALGEKKDGRYTGKIDEDLASRVRSGEIGLSELKHLARSKANSRGAKLSFAAHKERLRSEMVGAVGAEGVAMQLQSILGDRGWNNPDATNLVMQRFGASEEQANLLQKLMPNLETVGLKIGQQGRENAKSQARQAYMRENYSWDALKHKMSTKIKHVTTDWAKDIGVQVRDYFTNWADDFVDELTGTYRVEVTKRSANLFQRGLTGDRQAKDYIQRLTQSGMAQGALGNRNITLLDNRHTMKNLAKGAVNFLSGESDVNEQMMNSLWGMGNGQFMTWGKRPDDSFLGYGRAGGADHITTDTNRLMKAAEHVEKLGGGLGSDMNRQLRALNKGGSYDTLAIGMDRAMRTGGVINAKDATGRMDALRKRMRETVGEDFAAAAKALGGEQEVIMAMQQDKRFSNLMTTVDSKEVADKIRGFAKGEGWKTLSDRVKDDRRDLSKMLKGSDTTYSFAELEKFTSGDTAMGRLLTGTPGADNGFLQQGDKLGNLLLQNTFSEDQRKKLAAMGLSQKDIDELEKDTEGRKKLQTTLSSMGAGVKDRFRQAVGNLDLMGITKLTDDFKARGVSISQATASGGRNAALIERLSRETGGKSDAFLKKLHGIGESYSKGDFESGLTGFRGLTEDYASLDDKAKGGMDKFLREQGMEEVIEAGSMRRNLEKRRKKIGSGMDLNKFIGGDETLFGNDMAGRQLYAQLKEKAGKDGKVQSGEAQGIIDFIMKQKSAGLYSKDKSESGSTMMSETDVAKSLESMSKNAETTAQILKNLLDQSKPQ